jgi:hypothetical protein
MSKHLCALVMMISLLIPVPAHAQTIATDVSASGSQFLEVCSVVEKADRKERLTETDVADGAFCTGFMIGLSDGVGLSIEMLKHNNSSLSYLKGTMEDLAICAPAGMPVGQGIRIVLKYIREHPEQAHLPTGQLVVLAEFNAFPCAPPKPKQ